MDASRRAVELELRGVVLDGDIRLVRGYFSRIMMMPAEKARYTKIPNVPRSRSES